MTAEELAQHFHETYERLAPEFDYKTREASAVAWESMPENNKRLMIAVAGVIITLLGPEDKERLDFLQEHGTGYGRGWMARMSTTGRGLRVHETSANGATPNIRDAIDNYRAYFEGVRRS